MKSDDLVGCFIWLAVAFGVGFIGAWVIDGLFFDSCVFHLNSYDREECYRRDSLRRKSTERYYDQLERSLDRDGY